MKIYSMTLKKDFLLDVVRLPTGSKIEVIVHQFGFSGHFAENERYGQWTTEGEVNPTVIAEIVNNNNLNLNGLIILCDLDWVVLQTIK